MQTNIKKFKETIELYEDFIRNKKIGESSVPFYKKEITINKEIVELLENNKMTPETFSKFNNQFRWAISSVLKGIMWCCENCGTEITTSRPDRMFFPDEECECTKCYHTLTRRTNGGQNDPFNYTFKIIKRKSH